jgi:hypothetical protein
MITVNVRADVKALSRSLDALRYRQLPYATSLALTALARKVARAEVKNLAGVLDKPTPFTLNSVAVIAARKERLVATVLVKDIAARYLEPFEFGGKHVLNGRALLNPKNVALNQYGNLPRTMLARLKGRRGVFVGVVATKDGRRISGVWQRLARGHLKLLIRFGQALEVKQHLGWGAKAEATVRRWFDAEFTAAFRRALATAR